MDDGHDSDSDAPEAFTLEVGKRNALEREEAVKEFEESTKRKRKEANKAREAARIAAKISTEPTAKKSKRKPKKIADAQEKEVEVDALEARMHRAMQQAEEEEDMEADGDAMDGGNVTRRHVEANEEEPVEEGRWSPSYPHFLPRPSKPSTDIETPEVSSSSRIPIDTQWSPSRPTGLRETPHLLPDSMFEAAAASQKQSRSLKSLAPSSSNTKKTKKKKSSSSKSAKELVVGSRIVQVLSSTHSTVKPSLPPPKISKFVDIQLKGKRGRWERKAAYLANPVKGKVGPASKFNTTSTM